MSKIIKAVLFDLDGTLIDTEKYYKICWPLAFKHFGYDIREEQFLSLRSLGRPFILKRMQDWFGENIECEDIRKYARKLVDEHIEEEGLQLKKGAIECLKFLKSKDVITSIVTATAIERTEMCINKVDIKKYFDYVISATQVEKGKPAPDVYLYACEKIGIDANETLAVEDSPNGATSAIRAGCNVIMVPDLTEPDEELCKDLYGKLKSLSEFEMFIQKNDIKLGRK